MAGGTQGVLLPSCFAHIGWKLRSGQKMEVQHDLGMFLRGFPAVLS